MHLAFMRPKQVIPREELEQLCTQFNIGRLKRYRRIKEGNINTNYYVKTDKREYVFRFYTFKDEKEVREEHRILEYLFRKRFPTPQPVVCDHKTHLIWENRPVSCFSFIHGHHLKKLTIRNVKEIAAITAELHLITKDYKTSLAGEGIDAIRKGIKEKKEELITSGFRHAQELIAFLEKELATITFPKTLPRGIVHVDIKNENTLFRHRFESLLDFDNMYEDAFVIDIGSALMWWCTGPKGLNLRKVKAFLDTYREKRPLTKAEEAYITTALRFNLLKQAFKYAYICLPKKRFAEKQAWVFIRMYEIIKHCNI